MKWIKWVVVVVMVVVLGSILHYTLPRHEVVRIVGVETRLETFGFNRYFYAAAPSGMADNQARDVRYIETVRESGGELVFRNEDTGWIWPPYFKFDSADVQVRSRDLVSTSEDPLWVRISYYGFRSQLISIYPNILGIERVEGPDVSTIPWTRLIFFAALFGLAAWVWLALRRFREQKLEPFLDRVEDKRDSARGWLGRTWDRITGR